MNLIQSNIGILIFLKEKFVVKHQTLIFSLLDTLGWLQHVYLTKDN